MAATLAVRPPQGRSRFWTRSFVVTVAVVASIPVILAVAVGFFQVNPYSSEMLSSAGDDAHLFLSSFPDDSLVVEIAYQGGMRPPPSALSTLLVRIHETCSKASVTVDTHSFADSRTTFGLPALNSLELGVRQHWPAPGSLSLFYLYLNGTYTPTAGVIGLAFHASAIAVYERAIVENAPAVPGVAVAMTTSVMIHEFGHELGLVGVFGHVPNEDLQHPPHSDDPNDVMYWQVDSIGLGALGGYPTQFDAADLSDLQAMRWTVIPYELLPWLVLGTTALAIAYLVARERRIRRQAAATTEPPAP